MLENCPSIMRPLYIVDGKSIGLALTHSAVAYFESCVYSHLRVMANAWCHPEKEITLGVCVLHVQNCFPELVL